MDKEKFLEFASKAFDLGATFEINFYSEKFSEEFAKEIAGDFAQLVNGKVEEKFSSPSRWYKVRGEHNHLMAVFHNNSQKPKNLEVIA